MAVRDQLLLLVRLQEVVVEIRTAQEIVEGAAARLDEIESRFRERNAEYVAVKDRFAAVETDQRDRSAELGLLEEHRRKYMDDLMQVTNQREYAAMLKEIDGVKSQISEHEEAILKDMDELELLKTDLASREAHILEERKQVEQESLEVAAEVDRARRTIERLLEERKGIERELPRALLGAVERLEAGRAGVFLSKAVDGVCQTCYVRIRPQVFQEIRQSLEIHACSNCRRLLYHERCLRPEPNAGATATVDADVEAIKRGAI